MNDRYTNRELSWLDFNYRILSEARDKANPLFERLKFLSITSSNLDEFFMVRVASLKDMVHAEFNKKDIAGMTPKEQISAILDETHEFVNLQYSTYNRSLIPALKNEGFIVIDKHEALSGEQKKYVDQYFDENIYPVLTPMAVDSSRPFPLIRNKSLNIAALLEEKEELREKVENRKKEKEYKEKENKEKDGKREESKKEKKTVLEFATVQVPAVLPRVVTIPSEEEGQTTVILLEEIIERHIDKLFMNYKVVCAHPYRVMRNADLTIDEDDAEDLLKEIEKQLKKRQWGEAIRLEIEDKVDKRLLGILKEELGVNDHDIFFINGPLDFTFFMKLYGMDGFQKLKTARFVPQINPAINPEEDIFTQISRGDILLHHPYQTFDPVVDFVKQAARDPKVLAIKQTLYRVSGHSPIIASLAQAAENGKQVSVLVELKARFDEENNINWAKMLEKAGCHVIYGLKGLKTHSKITLVVRSEEDGIKRYVHLATGNYNDSTAKLYTDMGLFTCKQAVGEDATAVFNMLSGYSEPAGWNKLALAPLWLRDKFEHLIRREIHAAQEGKEAFIVAKMNSLCDKEIIDLLYEASAAGVKIDLIIRGICCLKAGMAELSENISVRSIVGNFLEHSRIFYFHNRGYEEIYMGSADWMPRNLDKRVEILFPVEDEKLKAEVIHILNIQLADTLKAHVMKSDGSYEKPDKRGKTALSSQDYFCKEAKERAAALKNNEIQHTFIPMGERNGVS